MSMYDRRAYKTVRAHEKPRRHWSGADAWTLVVGPLEPIRTDDEPKRSEERAGQLQRAKMLERMSAPLTRGLLVLIDTVVVGKLGRWVAIARCTGPVCTANGGEGAIVRVRGYEWQNPEDRHYLSCPACVEQKRRQSFDALVLARRALRGAELSGRVVRA